jgi:hypothetical protein
MSIRKALAATGIVATSIAGGALGASLLGTADAATPSPSPATGNGTAPGAGTRHSNEDPAHEAGESAEREAAENNGTADYGHHGGMGGRMRGGGSNEDPAHEAGESAAREAEEDAAANGGGSTAPSPSASLNP